jgi:hypothetical protein
MTPQEIFNTTARHCFTQGHQATGGASGSCLYLDSETRRKCAVGCHLSDAALSLVTDVVADVTDLLDILKDDAVEGAHVLGDIALIENNRRLFVQLQSVHDNETNWNSSERMRESFNFVAEDHGLVPLDETYCFTNR